MCLRLCLLLGLVVVVLGQRKRPVKDEWDYRDGSDKVNMRGVANLTQVLDNWKFDIMTQVKTLLQSDHQSVLPDYSRIQPLSEALADLFKEFNALKERLGDLSEKFVAIETFVDEVKGGQAAGGGAKPVSPVKKRVLTKKKAPASQSS
ncbi:uncharacterized protein LOC136712976 [Amia ocellicauda]|uniref:uncharacterized protein LOC136712976 n=1 Tax=Amia ocellicauda TaxID=2972642 RepID=UPI0034645DB4